MQGSALVVEFEVEADEPGGYNAFVQLGTHSLATQGDTLDELKAMVEDVLQLYAEHSGNSILSYSLVFRPAPVAS
jgi:predicted RNase H-like HicB family nuclease